MRAPAGEAVVVIFVRQPVAPSSSPSVSFASPLRPHPSAVPSLATSHRPRYQPHTLHLLADCPRYQPARPFFFTSRSGPCGRGRPPRRMRWTAGRGGCAGGGSHRPHAPDRLIKREPLPPSFSAKPRASPCARIHDQKANGRDRRLWHDLRASCAAVTSATWCFPDVVRAEAWKTCHRLRSRPGGSVSSKRTSRGALVAVPGSSCGRATSCGARRCAPFRGFPPPTTVERAARHSLPYNSPW